MSDKIKIPKTVISTPYKDHEHPSIRFNVKEDKDVTKHLLFYKTDKKRSFSEGHKPSDILFNMVKEIQTLPKIKNQNDEKDIEIFNKLIKFITPFIPHLVINSNSESNIIDVNDSEKDITIEKLHKSFKIASKGKTKTMLDRFIKD